MGVGVEGLILVVALLVIAVVAVVVVVLIMLSRRSRTQPTDGRPPYGTLPGPAGQQQPGAPIPPAQPVQDPQRRDGQ